MMSIVYGLRSGLATGPATELGPVGRPLRQHRPDGARGLFLPGKRILPTDRPNADALARAQGRASKATADGVARFAVIETIMVRRRVMRGIDRGTGTQERDRGVPMHAIHGARRAEAGHDQRRESQSKADDQGTRGHANSLSR